MIRTLAMESPLGRLDLFAEGDALTAIYFATHRHRRALEANDGVATPVLTEAAVQLGEYFAGTRVRFDLPLAPRGTAFQQRVWAALQEIPFGATTTYGEIAATLGTSSASRAVGAANGRNPLSIVVPCHRVVGADGALTGYAGGIAAKRWLLWHEREHVGHTRAAPPSSR